MFNKLFIGAPRKVSKRRGVKSVKNCAIKFISEAFYGS
jgi:hypothetical protein